jgi:hypothetical protein
VVYLPGYGYILRLAFDELALTKAYPANFRKQYTGIADIKALWISKAISTVAALLQYREPLWISLIESLLDCFVEGFQCLL